ncbi:hypothetical protein [Neobacillus sp. D3-1R]|uniref:hypothetical protein n=1 Tax=Neobacillus sp. D3-1R TaxID=3445778 RepID=UPI003F9F8062
MTRLSPPWYTLWNEIKNTIGKDPSIHIENLDVSQNPYQINIVVDDDKKGSALTTIIADTHQMGNISVLVQVINNQGVSYQGKTVHSPIELSDIVTAGLSGNPLFVKSIVQRVSPDPNAPTNVFPVFTKSVVQFFNDDLTDLYHNYNNVTAIVFSDILKSTVNGMTLDCSTDIN